MNEHHYPHQVNSLETIIFYLESYLNLYFFPQENENTLHFIWKLERLYIIFAPYD